MHRSLITSRARNLMTLHGLGNLWQIKIINSKAKAGSCRVYYRDSNPARSAGLLSFSAPAFEHMSDEECDDTILHEIAHALAPLEFDSSGRVVHHGGTWKSIARRIGCSGERTVDIAGLRAQKKWKAVCSRGHEFFRDRLTSSVRYNSSCPTCVNLYKIPIGKREALKWVANTGKPVLRSTPVPKTQNIPRPLKAGEAAWKDRFDQGSTSFDDVW